MRPARLPSIARPVLPRRLSRLSGHSGPEKLSSPRFAHRRSSLGGLRLCLLAGGAVCSDTGDGASSERLSRPLPPERRNQRHYPGVASLPARRDVGRDSCSTSRKRWHCASKADRHVGPPQSPIGHLRSPAQSSLEQTSRRYSQRIASRSLIQKQRPAAAPREGRLSRTTGGAGRYAGPLAAFRRV